ncbi:hypothetical protein ACETIH_24970, partial [Microvirga arabica]
GHRAGTACPPKEAVREEAPWLFHSHHHTSSRAARRATLDPTHRLAAHWLRATRCWLLALLLATLARLAPEVRPC